MTKIIETNVHEWTKPEKGPGIIVAPGLTINTVQQTDMCKFYGVPGVLPKVDATHNTRCVVDVMQSLTNDPVKFAVDTEKNEVITAIDPRSEFITDEQWAQMKESFVKLGLKPEADLPHYRPNTIGESWFEVTLPSDTQILGDVMRKTIQVERLPQGGCHLSAGLVRQICTNGAVVKEKDMTQLSRMRPFSDEQVELYAKGIGAWDLQAYLHDKWFKDGEPIEASVGDFYGMRSCLMKWTDKAVADNAFPTTPIEEFYEEQGIKLSEINNQLRNRIPSGLSYYDCFNFLTHGMKLAGNRSLEQDIEVAGWGFGKHIRGLRQTELAVHGKPHFDMNQIRILRGDKAAA